MTESRDNTTNPWCLEWSHSQHSFHISRLSQVIKQNYCCMRDGREADYILVGIANTYLEVAALAEKYQEFID